MVGNKLLAIGALIAGLLLPAQAMAAYEAYTRVDLNLRVGPDTSYGVIDVIPQGEPVAVLGCLEHLEWCDIEWFGLRGWVAAYYLVQPGTAIYLPQLAPRIGLPIISFSFSTYHEHHYRDRPWYKKRHGRWRGRDWRRGDRDHDRDRDRDRARDRDRDHDQARDRDRDRDRDRARERNRERERERVERPRQRQEAERPRRQRTEQRRERRREVERPRRQRAEQRRERRRSEKRSERRQERQRSEIRRRLGSDEEVVRQQDRGQ